MSKKKLNLSIPANLNEGELIKTIEEIAVLHCRKYVSPGHTEEDLMQIALIEGIDASHRWDGKRPLKNFLSVHIRNRLYNYKRRYVKMAPPCKTCPLNAYIKPDGCKLYTDKMNCDLYYEWYKKKIERQNVNSAINFDMVVDVNEDSMKVDGDLGDAIDRAELMDYIDKNVAVEFRQDYLIVLHGGRIGNRQHEKLIEHIREILWLRQNPEN